MSKIKRRNAFSGTVLIMVLTVMVVLIIMLMATLTVVSTAGQRIYTKYEENQAYYTARSALDVFTLNMLNDSDYYAYDSSGIRTFSYSGVNSTGNPDILTAGMKQGLALQADLYKIKSQGIDTAIVAAKHDSSFAELDGTPKSDAYEALGFAENMYEADDIFGNTGSDSAPENEFYAVSDDKLNNDADTSKQFDYIEYKITLPAVSDGSSAYGKLVDKNASGEQIATIRVEVLNRKYATSPDYTKEQIIDIIKSTDTTDDAALKAAIKAGDRSKDKFTIKITSTVTFMDTEGTAVLIYDSSERPVVNSTRAITTVSDINEGSGIIPIGGASSLSDGVFTTDDNTTIAGDIFLKGSFLNSSSIKCMNMYKNTLHTIIGDVTFNNVYPNFIEKGSVLYSQGNVNLNLNSAYGSAGKETNIVASNVNFNGNGKQMQYHGNIFSDVLHIDKENSSQSPTISGHIYTNYLDLRDYVNTFYPGSTAVALSNTSGNNISSLASYVTLAKGFIINVDDGTGTGNVVPEKFDWDGSDSLTRVSTGDIISLDTSTDIVPPVTYNSSSEVKIGYYNYNHYKYDEETFVKTFTLPAKLAGRTTDKLKVPTVKAMYREIFQESAFVNNDTGADKGKIGDLAIGEMPEFDTSGLILQQNDFYGTPIITLSSDFLKNFLKDELSNKGTWEIGSILDGYVANGIISATDKDVIIANWDDKVVSYYPTYDVQTGIKNAIPVLVETAKAADTDYQDELKAYYEKYISGAEKAGESDGSLLKFTSATSAITPKNLSDKNVTNPDDFKSGGAYGKLSSAKGIIDESGYLSPDTNYGTETNPVIIDARSNDITIQLGTGSSSSAKFIGYFIVVGDKTVKFYLPDGTKNYNLGETNSNNPFHISTYELEYADTLSLGDGGTTKSPNVYMYAGNNVKNVNIYSPGKYRLLTAHIYFPFAYFNMGGAGDAGATQYSTVKYNGYTVPMSGNGFSVIGSVIANKYKSNNNTGVAYVSPEQQGVNVGDPHLGWQPKQYTRN